MNNQFYRQIMPSFVTDAVEDHPVVTPSSTNQSLPSWFEVSDLATGSIAAAASMLVKLVTGPARIFPAITLDQRLASLWFDMTLQPAGWKIASPWDALAGDYRAKDGWIRLHTNAPHHRRAALSVLGQYSDKQTLAPVIEKWPAEELENAIVEAKGCAAVMHSLEQWANHPQGKAVASEPLIIWQNQGNIDLAMTQFPTARLLQNIKILDLTRVLAGPVAGRFLAAYGANVLRIDPLDWDEPGVIPEVTLGKRCAGLDLKDPRDQAIFEALLADADVLLHGYRSDALANLGYDGEKLRKINPRLIDVALNAYGWSGPWRNRRGFDSLMQMSTGIAHYAMNMSGADRPVPLPVQALDHATGYLLAASVLHALDRRNRTGEVLSARTSLARVAHLLSPSKRQSLSTAMPEKTNVDFDGVTENTGWGPAKRVNFPLSIEAMPHSWDYPSGPLRSSKAVW